MEKFSSPHKDIAEKLKAALNPAEVPERTDELAAEEYNTDALARKLKLIEKQKEFKTDPPGTTYHLKDPRIWNLLKNAKKEGN